MAFFERNYKVSVNDIGIDGVCTQKAILRFFETTACEHSDTAGCGISDIPKTNLSWILLQWKVNFLKKLRYGDRARIVTWARDTDAFTSYRDFKLYNGSDQLCAVATSKWALIDVDKGLTRIGNIIDENYNPERDCVFSERTLSKLLPPTNAKLALDYTVMHHDIDVNKHMHNLNYLDLALDVFEEGENFAFTEILYKTQCKKGDKLSLYKGGDENNHFIVIKLGEKLSAIVKFYN